jgi:ketosteroid isomerase-like protein
VRGAVAAPEARRERELVDAFLAASQRGDFAALLAVLDPDVTLRADATAVQASLARASRGAPPLQPEISGRERVAETFRGRAAAAQPATIDGAPGLVFAPGGRVFAAFVFVVENAGIVEIDLISDPDGIAGLRIEF